LPGPAQEILGHVPEIVAKESTLGTDPTKGKYPRNGCDHDHLDRHGREHLVLLDRCLKELSTHRGIVISRTRQDG
jgi:hypothetical protein